MYACMDAHVKARQNENSLLFAMSQVIQTTVKETGVEAAHVPLCQI